MLEIARQKFKDSICLQTALDLLNMIFKNQARLLSILMSDWKNLEIIQITQHISKSASEPCHFLLSVPLKCACFLI